MKKVSFTKKEFKNLIQDFNNYWRLYKSIKRNHWEVVIFIDNLRAIIHPIKNNNGVITHIISIVYLPGQSPVSYKDTDIQKIFKWIGKKA